MKVLLLGASGGVGSLVLQALAERGFEVTAMVRKSSERARKVFECSDKVKTL